MNAYLWMMRVLVKQCVSGHGSALALPLAGRPGVPPAAACRHGDDGTVTVEIVTVTVSGSHVFCRQCSAAAGMTGIGQILVSERAQSFYDILLSE